MRGSSYIQLIAFAENFFIIRRKRRQQTRPDSAAARQRRFGTRVFKEYKHPLLLLTHGEVSLKPLGDKQRAGRRDPSGHASNGVDVTVDIIRNHDCELLLIATLQTTQLMGCRKLVFKEIHFVKNHINKEPDTTSVILDLVATKLI